MKRSILSVSLIILIPILLASATVKNSAEPKQGHWDFKIKEILKIESFGDLDPALVQKIEIHDDGRIFIFDRTHFKFFVFDASGKYLTRFGKKGEGPGEIKMMLDFYLLKDRLIAYDMGKIHHLNFNGKLIKSVPANSTIGIAPNLFIDENRLVKVRRSFGRGVGGFRLEALEVFNSATGKTVYLDGAAPDAEMKGRGGTVMMLNIGANVRERRHSYITALYGKYVAWGMNDSYLIHLSDFSGNIKISFSVEGREKLPISRASKERLVSRMKVQVSGMSQAELKKRLIKSIPDHCTYFSQITSDKNQMIYVYTSDVALENGQNIDIFSPEGYYLYKSAILLPKGNTIRANGLIFKGDYLYMAVEDDEGEISIRKYSCILPQIK